MDEDIIEDIADALSGHIDTILDGTIPGPRQDAMLEATYDDIYLMAVVIHNHQPTYDLRYFYKRAGFHEPYPVHPID